MDHPISQSSTSRAAPDPAAQSHAPAQVQDPQKPQPAMNVVGYVCPLTGEVLPCPNCCPVKDQE